MEFLTEEQAEKATKIFLDAIGWSWIEDHHRYFRRGIEAVALFIDSLHKHSLEERILKELRENNHLLHHIINRLFPKTRSIAVLFQGEFMNSVTLIVGQSTTGTIVPLEADGITQTPGAVVSAPVFTISDPSLTATDNADGTVTIKGVAATTAPVSGTAAATVTDLDGTVSSLTQTFTVTVTAPTGRTISIGVSFSTPA